MSGGDSVLFILFLAATWIAFFTGADPAFIIGPLICALVIVRTAPPIKTSRR